MSGRRRDEQLENGVRIWPGNGQRIAGCNQSRFAGVCISSSRALQNWKQREYYIMKKIIVTVCCVLALAVAVQAQEAKKEEKKKPTPEQKALMKEIKTKYDTNKDGKLDKEERAKISAEDKAKLEKAGLGPDKKAKKGKKNK